ncbi:MAG: hypothetical protein ACREN8_12800 [Candidatus Dormibacteraceae bacterium]
MLGKPSLGSSLLVGRQRLRPALILTGLLTAALLALGFAPATTNAQDVGQDTMAQQISQVAVGPLVNYKTANDVGTAAYKENAQLGKFYTDLACSNGVNGEMVNQVKSSYLNYFAQHPDLAGTALPGHQGGILGSVLGGLGGGGDDLGVGNLGVNNLGTVGGGNGKSGGSSLGDLGLSNLGVSNLGTTGGRSEKSGGSGLSDLGIGDLGVNEPGATGVAQEGGSGPFKTNSLGLKFTMSDCVAKTALDCGGPSPAAPVAPTPVVPPVTTAVPVSANTTAVQPTEAALAANGTTYAQAAVSPPPQAPPVMPPALANLYKGTCGMALVSTGTFSPTDQNAVKQALKESCFTIDQKQAEVVSVPNCTPTGTTNAAATSAPVEASARRPVTTQSGTSSPSSAPAQDLQSILSRLI